MKNTLSTRNIYSRQKLSNNQHNKKTRISKKADWDNVI